MTIIAESPAAHKRQVHDVSLECHAEIEHERRLSDFCGLQQFAPTNVKKICLAPTVADKKFFQDVSAGYQIAQRGRQAQTERAHVQPNRQHHVGAQIYDAHQRNADFGNFIVAVEVEEPQQQRVKCLTDYAQRVAGNVLLQNNRRMTLGTENRRQGRAPEKKSCGDNQGNRAEENYRAVEKSAQAFIVSAPAILRAKNLHAHDDNPNQADYRDYRDEKSQGRLNRIFQKNSDNRAVDERIEKVRELLGNADEQQRGERFFDEGLLYLLRPYIFYFGVELLQGIHS